MYEFTVTFAIAFAVILIAGGLMFLAMFCFIKVMESESIFARIMWAVLCLSVPSSILALGVTFGSGRTL